jgi:S-adenosylmethionine decarboxylase
LSYESSREVVGLFAIGRDCAHDLHDPADLRLLAKATLAFSGAALVAEFEHVFVPHGLTIVLVAAESHLVLSTWPEFRTATLDMALCGRDIDPLRGWLHLAGRLQPASSEISTHSRKLA